MKYFIDFEFIEGFHKPLFGKRRHFIDLISVGVVCEDGRQYYAISKEFNPKHADQWVKDNVIDKLESKDTFRAGLLTPTVHYSGKIWRSNKQIKKDLLSFFGCWQDQHFWRAPEGIEVYGYYADYDWVLFCSLFGRMIDLPKGFPMYCKDLKQMLDNVAQYKRQNTLFSGWLYDRKLTNTFDNALDYVKGLPEYPKQENEHNALADAKWNYELYKFLHS